MHFTNRLFPQIEHTDRLTNTAASGIATDGLKRGLSKP